MFFFSFFLSLSPHRVLFVSTTFFSLLPFPGFCLIFLVAERTTSLSQSCNQLFWWSGVSLHPLTDISLVGLTEHRRKHEHSQGQRDQRAQQDSQARDWSTQDQPQYRWDSHHVYIIQLVFPRRHSVADGVASVFILFLTPVGLMNVTLHPCLVAKFYVF